jgi:molybdopterin-containing oxidoreductase family membrane subunit
MYGVLFARPFVFREGFAIWPWTFFLFILSAVSPGPMFTVLVCAIFEKVTGRKLVSHDVKALMGKIAGAMLLAYILFKIIDTYAWAVHLLPKSGMTFDQMFYGFVYGSWMLWAEILPFGLLPAIMLLMPGVRKNPALLYLAGALACIGVIINRYVMTVQNLALPVMPFDTWGIYIPNWVEVAPCVMVVGYSVLVLSLSYRYLPMFPQERELNP